MGLSGGLGPTGLQEMQPSGFLHYSDGWLRIVFTRVLLLLISSIWCLSGGGDTREAGGTVRGKPGRRSSSPLPGKYARASVRVESNSIVDESGEC